MPESCVSCNKPAAPWIVKVTIETPEGNRGKDAFVCQACREKAGKTKAGKDSLQLSIGIWLTNYMLHMKI